PSDWHHKFDKCEFNQCEFSDDKRDYFISDAILFHAPNVFRELKDLPPKPKGQIWVYMSQEPPSEVFTSYKNWNNAFNWTWTNRRDSDIYDPYGEFQVKKKQAKFNFTGIFNKKERTSFWYVSHCKTQGKREDFVKILKKYIDIDTMSSVERKRLNGRYICQECGIQCSSKSSFYRHTKQHLLNVEDVQEALGMIARNGYQYGETGESFDEFNMLEAEDFDKENKDDEECGDDSESEDEDDVPETWDSILEEEVDEDLGILVNRRSGLKSLNDLMFWLLYFILYWQSVCHVSDNGIEWLLRFLFQFFNILSLKVNHGLLTEFIMIFPTSMYMLRKLMTLDRDNFERFVVCRECFTTYRLDDCFNEINGVRKTKLCTHEYFKRNREYYCNTPLLKEVLLKDGSIKLYPHKVYCFNSLINGLEHILQKQNLPDLMCHWKSWSNKTNFLRDVYDGAVWRSFGDFFQGDRNLGLILNVDWIQPFKNRTDYSVGVIYFAILNLPRNIRYKFENVIVVGLIPTLKKEPSDLSPFLSPVMKELKALWKGVSLKTSLSSVALTIRAALVCVACDIPAARKVCGFKSHSAVLGCHRCFKNFPAASFGAKRNYSGFDRQNWKLRSKQLHNKYARRVLNIDMSGFDVANNVRAPESYKVSCLDAEGMSFLLNCYQHMYPSKTIQDGQFK
ncbi:hypothetical protein KUTeg_007933, partial [Tegillarca granosa]